MRATATIRLVELAPFGWRGRGGVVERCSATANVTQQPA